MDGFYDLVKKIKVYSAYPAVFVSVGLFCIYTLCAFGFVDYSAGDLAGVMFGAMFCAFTVYYTSKSVRKAVASLCSLLCGEIVLSTATGAHLSFVYCILITLLFWLIMTRTDLLYGFIITTVISVLLSFVFILLYDLYNDALRGFAGAIKGRGAAFGALESPFSLIFGRGFSELFYYKSYSATALVNGKITTGAVDLFASSDSLPRAVAEFLTGKYISGIVIPLGIIISLYKRLKKEILFAFLFSFILSVFFGDSRIFYLLLLTVSPLLYIGSLILTYIGYAVCGFIDIRIGFSYSGTIAELFRNMDKPVYFISVSVLMAVLSYFFTRLIDAKFHLLSNSELPRNVRRIVNALGGRRNILKVESGCVTVANPNLVDILTLDCDIRENRITLLPDDAAKLRILNE